MDDDAPTIPVRMNKRTTEKTLNHMNGDHLLGLRNIRRSENGPYVRSNNLAEDTTMRRKIDMWYKEQRYNIGHIKRGQVRFYQTLVRVHRAKRKGQRVEYKRKQEELRKDMDALRLRRLLRRVVDKFRQNVKRKKNERAKKRFGIARGLKPISSKDGDQDVNKHGVFGVKSQSRLGSISRIVALAQKKDELQKEGVIPTTKPETPKEGTNTNDVRIENSSGTSQTEETKEGNSAAPKAKRSSDPNIGSQRQEMKRHSNPDVKPSTQRQKRTSNPDVTPPQSWNRTSETDNDYPNSIHRETIPPIPTDDTSKQESKTPSDVDEPNSTQRERRSSNPVVDSPIHNGNRSSGAIVDILPNPSSAHPGGEIEKKQNQRINEDLLAIETKHKPTARLSVENLALHEELQKELQSKDSGDRNSEQGLGEMNAHSRGIVKTTVLEVNKHQPEEPKSRTLTSQRDTKSQNYKTVNDADREAAVVETEYPESHVQPDQQDDKVNRPYLGPLKVPRRASIKPPPLSLLLDMDRFTGEAVDAVGLANRLDVRVSPINETAEEEGIEVRRDSVTERHGQVGPMSLPVIPLSRVIREKRREEVNRRTLALDKELVPHYKRNKVGDLVVQMVPFHREPFNPPSNKVKYLQEKLMKEEKINMARQRVRLRHFIDQVSTEDEQRAIAIKRATEERRKTLAEKSDNLRGQQAPLTISTIMFSVYHQEMPPEGVDRNSVEALKKCKYIRYYDLPNSVEHKKELKRRQKSSWESPTAYEQKQRRLLQLRRQRAAVYR